MESLLISQLEILKESKAQLTIEQVKQLAMNNYENGGDTVIETWSDSDIQDWIEEDGTKAGLLKLFNMYKSNSEDMKGYGDYETGDTSDTQGVNFKNEDFYQVYYIDEDDKAIKIDKYFENEMIPNKEIISRKPKNTYTIIVRAFDAYGHRASNDWEIWVK